MDDFNFFVPLSKIDKERRLVSGYASTPTKDLDGEVVSLDAVKNALPGYMQWRNIRRMHSNDAVGVAKEANVDSKGLFLTAKIVDDTAWKGILEDVYKGFSIGGKKLTKVGNTITEIDLVEISIVDRPANPDCKFEVAKRAKDAKEAYLTKLASPRLAKKELNILSKAINFAEGISEFIIRDREPDFSKRDFSEEQRTHLASSGKAMPDGSFPIANEEDLHNAIRLAGNASDPKAARKHIKSRARDLGCSDAIPETWTKLGRANLQKQASEGKVNLSLALPSAEPPFLNLPADSALTTRGEVELGHGLDLKRGGTFGKSHEPTSPDDSYLNLFSGVNSMEDNSTDLNKVLMDMVLAKAAKDMSPMDRVKAARGEVKKARSSASEAEDCIKAVHAMHKSAYLAKQALVKAGKKPKDFDEDNDFDHQASMEKLSKAYQLIKTFQTFTKAANEQLKKVSRSGQRGQEVTDPEGKFFMVPDGLREISPDELSTAGPGSEARVTMPQPYMLDGPAHKGAKNEFMTVREAAVREELAAEKAKNEILSSMPMGGQVRPYGFNLGKGAKTPESYNGIPASAFDGIDPRSFASLEHPDGPAHAAAELHKSGSAKLLGNFISNRGNAKPIFDPNFHGTAGANNKS